MKTTILFVALAAAFPAAANVPAPELVAGGQYTATWRQADRYWRFHLGDGRDVFVNAARRSCAAGPALAPGVWLLVRDADGTLALQAPSVTALQAGIPDRVRINACGAGDRHALELPAAIIERAVLGTGAVYVDE